MITLDKARLIANEQNSTRNEGIAIEAAIKAAAQLGGFLASYTFPIDYSSANLKDTLDLEDFVVAVTTAQVLGVAATFDGQAAGMTTDVVITADETGALGNDISLEFDGVLTVSEVLDAWNLANDENTASLISGDGDQVPDNLEVIDLATGVTAVAEVISIDFGPA